MRNGMPPKVWTPSSSSIPSCWRFGFLAVPVEFAIVVPSCFIVPKGQNESSSALQRRVSKVEASSPEGTTESVSRSRSEVRALEIRILSTVPTGLGAPAGSIPALKRGAIVIDVSGIPVRETRVRPRRMVAPLSIGSLKTARNPNSHDRLPDYRYTALLVRDCLVAFGGIG